MSKRIHFLSNIDKTNKTATCSECGQVAVIVQKTAVCCLNRYKAYRIKYNEQRRKTNKQQNLIIDKNGIKYANKPQYIKEQKNKPCMDCGISYPYYVMDFDHRNPAEKSGNLARMTASPFEEIVAEIAKCDVVCANCHRERTYGKKANPPIK